MAWRYPFPTFVAWNYPYIRYAILVVQYKEPKQFVSFNYQTPLIVTHIVPFIDGLYTMATNYRQELNNYIQKKFKNHTTLQWTRHQYGPEHLGLWEAVALINHVEYGRASAPSLGAAQEEAARQALGNLRHTYT